MQFSWRFTTLSIVIVVLGLIYLLARGDRGFQRPLFPPEPVAAGLNNPRALAFGSDGRLYVAEAGTGEPTSGQITRIGVAGSLAVIAEGLAAAEGRGPLRPAGPVALAPRGSDLLVASEGGGGQLLRVGGSRPAVPALDLRAALTKVGLAGAAAPLGLVGAARGDQVVLLEAVSATLVRLDLSEPGNARPTVVGRLPAGVTPVAMAPGPEGDWLVMDFGPLPYKRGGGAIWRVRATGEVEIAVPDLTLPIAATTGAQGELYVVEFSAFYNRRTDRFTPRSGRVLVARGGTAKPMVERLHFPTAIVRSADNYLYYTTSGAFSEAGTGRVWRLRPRSVLSTATP